MFFTRSERTCEIGQILGDREKNRAVKLQSLDNVNFQSGRACHVCGMTGDFPVTLECVHVSQIDAAAGYFDRADEDGAFANRVDVEMAVGLVCDQLFLGQ